MKTKIEFVLQQSIALALMGAAQYPLMQVAQAATDLSDKPILVSTLPAPNIMLTLDNSGSMRWGYMPGDIAADGPKNCFANAYHNVVYYNPAHHYYPGRKSDGTAYPNSTFTAAYVNGYDLGYIYATTGLNYQPSLNGYVDLGGMQATPVDLSKNFQATFDVMTSNRNSRPRVWYVTAPDKAYYYKYNGAVPPTHGCYPEASYTKVYIGAAEQQNFANWFTYYRTRMLTMKTVLTQTFGPLDDHYRVGLSTINDNATGTDPDDSAGQNLTGVNFVPVNNFSTNPLGTGQKNRWFSTIINLTDGGTTPLVEAVRRIGEYYSNRSPYPPLTYPDPIQKSVESCQRNYQVVFTDGYWNVLTSDVVGPVTDSDATVPSLPGPVAYDPIAKKPLQPGQPFPPPFGNGALDSYSLADVTMKYWTTNLRPTAPLALAVVQSRLDPATWPHMSTYGISLGEGGVLPNDAATYDALVSGNLKWPAAGSSLPGNIDDLWHASLNGHGQFLSAGSGPDLRTGIERMLVEMNSGTFAGAALAVSKPEIGTGNSLAFKSSYDPGGWSGDLTANAIDGNTGVVDPAAKWHAQTVLDAMDWRMRNIATSIPSGSGAGNLGVAFSPSTIPAGILARLSSPVSPPGPSDSSNVISFLRGDRSGEGDMYRSRTHVLGDPSQAEPVYVGPPAALYRDNGYAAYAKAHAARPGMVYQAANDGMLHAFDAATGAERWAYVPGLLLEAPYVTTTGINRPGSSSLVNLSVIRGFTHLPYVDGTPVVGDIDLGRVGGVTKPANWKTLLVGGLRKGGRGYYALDITNLPTAKTGLSSPDTAASLAMWEFPQQGTASAVVNNLGYSYGDPVIVKTPGMGWVVLVTSGYNNGTETGGDGRGHLFVLNAATGNLIRDISTPIGSAFTPSGLAQVAAYAEANSTNNTTDFVYGGDLLGNMWRFDLQSPDPSKWNVRLLATLVDANGVAQPITSGPELANVNTKRVVYVGTGQYLGMSDLPQPGGNLHSQQVQTIYGLLDDLSALPTIAPLRTSLVKQTLSLNAGGKSVTVANQGVDLTQVKGWYIDLPNQFERLVQRPILSNGSVAFATMVPSLDMCEAGGGNAWLYTLSYLNGGVVDSTVPTAPGVLFERSFISRPVTVRAKDGGFRSIVRLSYPKPAYANNAAGQEAGTATNRLADRYVRKPGVRGFWREISSK